MLKELNAQQKEIAKIVDSSMELILLVTMDILHDNPALKVEHVFLSNAIGNSFGLGVCGFNTGANNCEKAWSVRALGDKFNYYLRAGIAY